MNAEQIGLIVDMLNKLGDNATTGFIVYLSLTTAKPIIATSIVCFTILKAIKYFNIPIEVILEKNDKS